MYFDTSLTVTIAGTPLKSIISIETKNDSQHIGSSCEIKIPLMGRIEKQGQLTDALTGVKFVTGDNVEVKASYKGYEEIIIFAGFIVDFVEGTPLTIFCQDEFFLLNKKPITLEFKGTNDIKKIVKDILSASNSDVTLIDTPLALPLVDISFSQMTPAAMLDYLKQQLGLNISLMYGGRLFMNLATVYQNNINFDTRVNVISSNLQRPLDVYRAIKLTCEFYTVEGKKDTYILGDDNGIPMQSFFYKIDNTGAKATVVSDGVAKQVPKVYKDLAEAALVKCRYLRFNGELETYLYPDCKLFDKVTYYDDRYLDRNGTYVIVSMNISIGENGFHRKMKLYPLGDE